MDEMDELMGGHLCGWMNHIIFRINGWMGIGRWKNYGNGYCIVYGTVERRMDGSN